MSTSNKVKHSFLFDFLINEKLRIWRHIILIVTITIIAINGTFATFAESYTILANKIYCIVLFSLFLDLVVIYFNLYILVPKLLLRSKYLQYIVTLSFLAFFFIGLNFSCEYYIFKKENISFGESSAFNSPTNFLVEFLYSLVIYSVLIVSVSMTALFKSWLINSQRVSQLETAERRVQLENMKKKISPSFLSRILRKSASLAVSTPLEASGMLLKLSEILRYQLHDCSRDKVLLNSEIDFLTNYLDLEKRYNKNFDYKIRRNGDVTHAFIPPLLFIPFLQKYVMNIQNQDDRFMVELQFTVKKNQMQFSCVGSGINKIDYSEIGNRLELLFSDQYTINIKDERELIIKLIHDDTY